MSSTIFSAKCFLCLRVANLHDFWWWTVGELNLKCMQALLILCDFILKFFNKKRSTVNSFSLFLLLSAKNLQKIIRLQTPIAR